MLVTQLLVRVSFMTLSLNHIHQKKIPLPVEIAVQKSVITISLLGVTKWPEPFKSSA